MQDWKKIFSNTQLAYATMVAGLLEEQGIDKFILIGENVLNFHSSDDSYYEEWFAELEDGWIAMVNFREHVLDEFKYCKADYYLNFGGDLDTLSWRKHTPIQLFKKVEDLISKRLN